MSPFWMLVVGLLIVWFIASGRAAGVWGAITK